MSLGIRALQDNVKVVLGAVGEPSWDGHYSFDNENWIPYTIGQEIVLEHYLDEVYFYEYLGSAQTSSKYLHFQVDGGFEVFGNISSLQGYGSYQSYKYRYLFDGCEWLVSAEELFLDEVPTGGSTANTNMYAGLFHDCTQLQLAPTDAPPIEKTGTRVPSACFSSMFSGCISLRTTPSLPNSFPGYGLTTRSYANMFKNCSYLTILPDLPATNLDGYCYTQMFNGCTSIHLDTSPSPGYSRPWMLPIPESMPTNNPYTHMFINCPYATVTTPEPGVIYYTNDLPSSSQIYVGEDRISTISVGNNNIAKAFVGNSQIF